MIGAAWWLNGLALWIVFCIALLGWLAIGFTIYEWWHRND